MAVTLRPARPADAEHLPDVERDAGESFLAIPDLAWLASDKVMSAAAHLPAIMAGTSWLAEDAAGGLVAFLTAEYIDDALHIWELAVRRAYQRRGIGAALVGVAADHARARGLRAVTLKTFRDVVWNAPFYVKHGFRVLEGAEIDERLSAILQGEAENGLPPDRRCAMRFAMTRGPG